MSQVLMPKATAVWLVENSTLTFDQISAFTGLHPLEVQAIADGEVAGGAGDGGAAGGGPGACEGQRREVAGGAGEEMTAWDGRGEPASGDAFAACGFASSLRFSDL